MLDWTFNRRAALALLSGAAFGWAGPARAQEGGDHRFRRLQDLIDDMVSERRLAGAVVSVKIKGAPTQFLSAGRVAMDAEERATPDTLYRIYSMTKPVTGLAGMLLIQDGVLSLDQPVTDIVPEFSAMRVMIGGDPQTTRPAERQMTIRHLLTHTAGLSYVIGNDGRLDEYYRAHGIFAAGPSNVLIAAPTDGAEPASLEEFAARVAQAPLSYEPGSWWRYSISLDILGLVIQRAASMPFDEFLRTRIFAPLRMTDTFFRLPPEKASRFTTNYRLIDRQLLVADDRANSPYAAESVVPYGGSGLISSARDYARFVEMLLNEGALDGVRVFTRETIRAARANLLPEGIDRANSGLSGDDFGAGVGIRTAASARQGQEPPGSYSWGGAAGTRFWVDPVNELGVVFMTQIMPPDAYDLTNAVARAFYADYADLPEIERTPVDMLSRPRRNF
ncbi:MAG: serine hydrolase domain-containing protein [Hyphomonadaceae bacterium]